MRPDPLDLPDPLDPKVKAVTMGVMVLLDFLDAMVEEVKLALLDLPGLLEFQDLPDLLDPEVIMARMGVMA